jgi:hypothetical protein
MVRRFLLLTYGILSYLLSLAIFLYAVGFVGGFLTPTRLDGPRQGSARHRTNARSPEGRRGVSRRPSGPQPLRERRGWSRGYSKVTPSRSLAGR